MFDHLRDRRHDRRETASLTLCGLVLALLFAAFPLGLGELTSARGRGPGPVQADAIGTAADESGVVTVSFAARGCDPVGSPSAIKRVVGRGATSAVDCARGQDASLAQ